MARRSLKERFQLYGSILIVGLLGGRILGGLVLWSKIGWTAAWLQITN